MESIPLQDLGKLAEQVNVTIRETATNTDLDIREFLWIAKAFQRFRGEIVKNLPKSLNLIRR